MKATGIVRRIDDLGRVVIPKEIRRTMRIREGDPLEIYTDRNGEVIFKKYSPMGELNTFVSQLCDSVTGILSSLYPAVQKKMYMNGISVRNWKKPWNNGKLSSLRTSPFPLPTMPGTVSLLRHR